MLNPMGASKATQNITPTSQRGDMVEDLESNLERAQYLQSILVARATGENADNQDYQLLRTMFVADPRTKVLLPGFVKTNRELGQFWQFIKPKFEKYAERRNFIYSKFMPLLDYLEGGENNAPSDESISDGLKKESCENDYRDYS